MLDFTYIDDTVNGIIQCIQKFCRAQNNVFNIASGKSVHIIDIAQMIIERIGSSSNLHIKPNRTGEIIQFRSDISKAMQLLKYSPKTFIVEGITKAIAWYEQYSLIKSKIQNIENAYDNNILPNVKDILKSNYF